MASSLAGGDCIDDADVLRSGSTGRVLGCVVKAPSTLGTFPRGHVHKLARDWTAGAGPGDVPLTIDLASTICETYGLVKNGTRRHGYTSQLGYHPLLAIATGTGEVLMSRLREGWSYIAPGHCPLPAKDADRVRYVRATGHINLQGNSGFRTHAVVDVCRRIMVCLSITGRQHQSLRSMIEAIPDEDWTLYPIGRAASPTWPKL